VRAGRVWKLSDARELSGRAGATGGALAARPATTQRGLLENALAIVVGCDVFKLQEVKLHR
jgi:hypothetical protein